MKTTRFIHLGMTIMILCLFSILTYAEEPPLLEEEFLEERRLSEEDILNWVRQHVPQEISDLQVLKRENPREYEEQLHWIAEKIQHLEHVKQQYPEMYDRLIEVEKLEHQSWKMAEEIPRIRDAEKKKQLTAQLRDVLEKIFEIRLEERSLEIKELEKELDKMKALIEKRKAMKDTIINRRLKELIPSPENEALDWW
jgi:hypothetical protein